MSRREIHLAGLIGVVASACFIVAFLLDPTPPVAGARGAAVIRHVIQFGGADRAAAFLFAASGTLLIAFIAGLRALLRSASSGPRWAGTVLLAGGIQAGTMLASTSVIFFTIASRAGIESRAQASLLSDLANYGFVFAGFGVLLLVAAGTVLMLHSAGVLRVLGELGVAVAVLLVVYLITAFFSSGPLVAGGVVSILGFSAAGLWIGLTSLALLVLEPDALCGPASTAPIAPAPPA